MSGKKKKELDTFLGGLAVKMKDAKPEASFDEWANDVVIARMIAESEYLKQQSKQEGKEQRKKQRREEHQQPDEKKMVSRLSIWKGLEPPPDPVEVLDISGDSSSSLFGGSDPKSMELVDMKYFVDDLEINMDSSFYVVGRLASAGTQFFPLLAVAQLPYKYMDPKSLASDLVSKQFFAADKFYNREWNL